MTGTIGDAALGLDILKGGAAAAALADDAAARDMLVGRYRVPQPRNALAQGGSRSRQCGHGRIRRPCRRSRQALRGIRRLRRDRRAEHPVVGCRRQPCWRAAPSASRPSFPAATIMRSCARFRRIAFEAFAQGRARRRGGRDPIGTIIAGNVGPEVSGRAGRGNGAAAAVLQPFLGILEKSPFRRKYLPKSSVFASRGVAPGIRFWHGPADLRPPFWAG